MIPGRDTTRRRRADSRRPLVLLRRLAAAAPDGLWFHTVPLWRGSAWSAEDIASARLAAETLLGAAGGPPARVWLEAGRGGQLHLHIITPAPVLPAGPGADRRRVYDLERLAAYLSKPRDARLARLRPPDLRRYSPAERRAQFVAALEDEARQRAARHGRRCPARVWSFRAASSWRPPRPPRRRRVVRPPARPLAAPGRVARRPGPAAPARPLLGVPARPALRSWGRWSACVE